MFYKKLFVMLHNDPNDDLFLDIVLLLEICQTIRTSSALAPFKHRRSVGVIARPLDANPLQKRVLSEWDEFNAVIRLGKVEYVDTRTLSLVFGRLHDTVNGGL